MKRTVLLLTLCLMVTPAIASAYSLPILDPGFEAAGWNWGSGWGNYDWGDTGTSRSGDPDNTTTVKSGSQSAQMVVSAPAKPGAWINEAYVATQNVAISGADGLLLNYSAWMNVTSEKDGEAFLEVAFKDSGGGSLGPSIQGPKLTDTTGGWVLNTLNTLIPSGTASADFNIVTYGGSWDTNNYMTAYFDDTSAQVIPEPASLLLLGSGLLGLFVYGRKKR